MGFLKKIFDWFKTDQINENELKIVLDTSALQYEEGMEYVDKSSKVILLTGTIKEMDDNKQKEGKFGYNIRLVAKRSREDIESIKYVCVGGYDSKNYHDENIIDFCRKNVGYTILTGDNNLCNTAKAYGIKYIFVEEPKTDDNNPKKENNTSISTNNAVYEPGFQRKIEKEEFTEKEFDKEAGIGFFPKFIQAKAEKGCYQRLKLERDGVNVPLGYYKNGDTLYVIKGYKNRRNEAYVMQYRIDKRDEVYGVIKQNQYHIYYMNQIFKLPFSEQVQEEIRKVFLWTSSY